MVLAASSWRTSHEVRSAHVQWPYQFKIFKVEWCGLAALLKIDYTNNTTQVLALLLLVLICRLGNMSQDLSSVSVYIPARPTRRSLSSGPSGMSTPLSPSFTPSTTDDEEIKQNPRSAVWKHFKLVRIAKTVDSETGANAEETKYIEYSVCMVSAATESGHCGWKCQG